MKKQLNNQLKKPLRTLLTQIVLTAMGLSWALSACTPTASSETALMADSTSDRGNGDIPSSEKTNALALSASINSASANSAINPDSPPALKNCRRAKNASQPLSKVENTPVFDQFNFRPESVTVFRQTIAVKTPRYTFHFCKDNQKWVVVSNDLANDEKPYDYKHYLAEIADPKYETIEVDGTTYEYRIRLQAGWLTDELARQAGGEPVPKPQTTATSKDAVYFELKKADGEVISRELYTTSDVQAARLGASLGVPSIAGAAVAGSDIWFAATTSQGEGDSGFASLLHYDSKTQALSVQRPEKLQGDQLTDLVATERKGLTTLWMGTQRSGEGNPFFPASGLVSYQPESEILESFTVTNSPLVGAIPRQLAVENKSLWVATGDGTCRVQWQAISKADSWKCWQLTTTAKLPKDGMDVYSSFLATEPEAKLTEREAEVLWISQTPPAAKPDEAPGITRYEVVYKPGFETTLPQGGYQIADAATQRAAGGDPIFWPGRQWHWAGDRFKRGLDEVSLNLFGGGPYGLVSSSARSGLTIDNNAIRGDFDLLGLTSEGTKVRYYSGWVNSDKLEVYPSLRPVTLPQQTKPNPLPEMASDLPTSGP